MRAKSASRGGPAESLLSQVTGSNFSYQHRSLTECFDDMVDLGRTAIELWGVAPELHVPTLSNNRARTIARDAKHRGLDVICFTPEQVAYPVNIASPDSEMRKSSIAMFERAAELAVELATDDRPPFLFLTSGRGYESEPVAEAWARSVDALRSIVECAGRLGVECVLEPLQRVESNLVTSCVEAARMLAEVDHPGLGIVLDTVAMAAAGETVDDYFSVFGDEVKHVHLVDGAPTGHLAWGEGELPLVDILASLRGHGYRGWMTVELFGDGGYALDPRPALEQSLSAIRKADGSFRVRPSDMKPL